MEITVSGNDLPVSGNGIELNPDILNYSRKSYSSLTDINNGALFTDEYAARASEINREKENNYKRIAAEVFIKDISGNDAEYENVKAMMFSGNEPKVLVRPVEGKNSVAFTLMGVCIIAALFMAAVLIMLTGRKK